MFLLPLLQLLLQPPPPWLARLPLHGPQSLLQGGSTAWSSVSVTGAPSLAVALRLGSRSVSPAF